MSENEQVVDVTVVKQYIAEVVDFMFDFYANTHTYLDAIDENSKDETQFDLERFLSSFYDKCMNDQVNMGQHVMCFEHYHETLFGENFHDWNKKRWEKDE